MSRANENAILHRNCLIAAVVITSGLLACRRTSQSAAPQTPTDWTSTLREEVYPRAAFDLDCPAQQLDGKCLDTDCHTAGVSGCGRRATYTFMPAMMWGQTGQWVMNSAGVSSAPTSAAPNGLPASAASSAGGSAAPPAKR